MSDRQYYSILAFGAIMFLFALLLAAKEVIWRVS